jgi:hypothetical protein
LGSYWAFGQIFHFQISSWLPFLANAVGLLNNISKYYPNLTLIQFDKEKIQENFEEREKIKKRIKRFEKKES